MSRANRTDDVALLGVSRAPRWLRRTAWAVVWTAGAAEVAGLLHLMLSR